MSLKKDKKGGKKREKKSSQKGAKEKKERDWLAEFRSKWMLTEKQVNLMKTRLNSGRLSIDKLPKKSYTLSKSQTEKGMKWLRPRAKRPSAWKEFGVHASNARLALGWNNGTVVGKNVNDWESMQNTRMKLVGFKVQRNPSGKPIFHYPVYRLSRKVKHREMGRTYSRNYSFDYYVKFGEVNVAQSKGISREVSERYNELA